MRPTAISTIDTMPSLLLLSGLSGFGGGKLTRAMVADVHPIHQPAHTIRSMCRV